MKLAARKVDISLCPYASEEAIKVLGEAYEPPVKAVELGKDKHLRIGEETVLYRHEKTFVNQTALAVNIDDTEEPEKIEKLLKQIKNYVLERVGETLSIDMVSVNQRGNDPNQFVMVCQKAWEIVKRPLIIRSPDPDSLRAAASALKGTGGIIASATSETAADLSQAARVNGHALAVSAPDLDELVVLIQKIKDEGFNNLILHFQTYSLAEQFQTNSISRRSAIKNNYKPLGYPNIHFVESGDYFDTMAVAVSEICKYGGVCILPSFDAAQLAALMTLRQNIYTDPQKPIQVEPRIYPIGEPQPDSPVFVTTNFSLTYFIVSGEIENAGISAWLLVPECEGMSVLTAWAAGKFSGATIGKFAKEISLDHQVTSRRIIIPGYVAQISGELEENLPGWSVLVGPQDAADLESFIKIRLKK
jgi:acetyl-CoA decarbonylase/synthase complex subunit gamma